MGNYEPALGKQELKEVFMELSDKIEEGFISSLDKRFRSNLVKVVKENSKVLRQKDLDYINDSTILELQFGTRITGLEDGIWSLKRSNGKELEIKEKDDRLELYVLYSLKDTKLTMKEMKGIIVEEICRRDSIIIVEKRKGLKLTADSPEEYNEEYGHTTMKNRRKRRIMNYKDRVDKLIKKTGVL